VFGLMSYGSNSLVSLLLSLLFVELLALPAVIFFRH
jgi:hypothetical protein